MTAEKTGLVIIYVEKLYNGVSIPKKSNYELYLNTLQKSEIALDLMIISAISLYIESMIPYDYTNL